MAELTPNDLWQDRGIIKVTDGTYFVDVDQNGKLHIKFDSDFNDIEGNAHQINVSDLESRNLLNSILKQLKIMNFHLSTMTDLCVEHGDVEV